MHQRHNGNVCFGQASCCDVVTAHFFQPSVLDTFGHLHVGEPLLFKYNSTPIHPSPLSKIPYLSEPLK